MTAGASLIAVDPTTARDPERGADEKSRLEPGKGICHVHFEASTSVVSDFFDRGRHCRTSARTNHRWHHQARRHHRHEWAAFQRHRSWSVEAAGMAAEEFGFSINGRRIEILSADHQN